MLHVLQFNLLDTALACEAVAAGLRKGNREAFPRHSHSAGPGAHSSRTQHSFFRIHVDSVALMRRCSSLENIF